MSWMAQLYATYENMAGKRGPNDPVTPIDHMHQKAQDEEIARLLRLRLAPIAHTYKEARVEVTLNQAGEFRDAVAVGPKDRETLIPVTEDSAGRTTNKAPHALCDELPYVAGDYERFAADNEKQKKKNKGKYEKYISALEDWVKSPYTHPKAEAVYTYLSEKRLVSDLIVAGSVRLTDGGKISGSAYGNALVRFRILSSDNTEERCWEDPTLINAYIDYYLSKRRGDTDICYLTGKKQSVCRKHPKGIDAAHNVAKLISANDEEGFTYRGRFSTPDQAFTLGYETSQKIHNALTWLVKTRGVYAGQKDKRTFVCWNPKGKETPDVLDAFGLVAREDETDEAYDIVSYKRKLAKTFGGYTDQFDENDTVIVMGLDAASDGRMAITYYNEWMARDFFSRVKKWGDECNWYISFGKHTRVETPSFDRIVKFAFGTERDPAAKAGDAQASGIVNIAVGTEQKRDFMADDRVVKEQTERLLKCMLDGQRVPYDIVRALVSRASRPISYSKDNRELVLSTACAVLVKFYRDRGIEKGENEFMELDLQNHDRSYLFGRLLAVCEKVERLTFDSDEKREPNAIRLQSAYANHPFRTWRTLEELLNPYFRELYPGQRAKYKNLIGEIIAGFSSEDEKVLNQRLSENYLLGYYLQRRALNAKSEAQNLKEEKADE